MTKKGSPYIDNTGTMITNDRWHLYDLIQPSTDFDDLLKELDRDPPSIFWG